MIALAVVGMLTTAFIGYLAGVVVASGAIRGELEDIRNAELEGLRMRRDEYLPPPRDPVIRSIQPRPNMRIGRA